MGGGRHGLGAIYKRLHPFHQNFKVPMPTEICKGEGEQRVCHTAIQLEDNSKQSEELFKELLAKTEAEYDVESSSFLASPLGKQYQSLKNFLHIYQKFQGCQSNAAFWTEGNLQNALGRFVSNSSLGHLEGKCETWQNRQILSTQIFGLMDEVQNIEDKMKMPVESQLEDRLLLESLKRGIAARVFYTQNFTSVVIKKKYFKARLLNGLCIQSEQDLCHQQERSLLAKLIDLQVQKLLAKKLPPSPLTSQEVAKDLNSRLAQINQTLHKYTQQKRQVEQEWKKKDAQEKLPDNRHTRQRLLPRRQKGRQARLLELKKEIFQEYRQQYVALHKGVAAGLLQTRAVQEATGLKKLEEWSPKYWGIAGFEQGVLKETGDFSSLKLVGRRVARDAVEESISRIEQQIREIMERKRKKQKQQQALKQSLVVEGSNQSINPKAYNRERLKNLEWLLTVNPASAGHILINNPQYTDTFCKVAQSLAIKERNRKILEQATYMGLGVGITVAGVASAGGALPPAALIGGFLAGVAFTAGDYLYQKSEAGRNQQLQSAILNAYLAGTGDKQSIEDVREKWKAALEADRNALWALGFGFFDLIGVAPAVRAGSFVRLTKTLKGFDSALLQNKKLLWRIAPNGKLIKSIRYFKENYPQETFIKFLNFLAELPVDKQKKLLRWPPAFQHDDIGRLSQVKEVKEILAADELIALQKALPDPLPLKTSVSKAPSSTPAQVQPAAQNISGRVPTLEKAIAPKKAQSSTAALTQNGQESAFKVKEYYYTKTPERN